MDRRLALSRKCLDGSVGVQALACSAPDRGGRHSCLLRLGDKECEAAKEFHEAIEAQRARASRAGAPKEVLNAFAEMSIRAARRIGELLAGATLSRGGRPRNGGRASERQTLSALRLNKNQSSRWRRLASIPPDVFEAYVAESKRRGETPSVAKLLRLAEEFGARSRAKRRVASGNGDVVPHSAASSSSNGSAEIKQDLGDLKDHLAHLGDLIQSPQRAPAEKHAEAVQRRVNDVLREMLTIVERLERS